MAADPNKRGPAHRKGINVNEEHELRYWSEKFGVTRDELNKAVTKVGVMAADVEKELKKQSRRPGEW
jgi:uncharacterized protein DUF3606